MSKKKKAETKQNKVKPGLNLVSCLYQVLGDEETMRITALNWNMINEKEDRTGLYQQRRLSMVRCNLKVQQDSI